MKSHTLLPAHRPVVPPLLSGNDGITRMDILFRPTPDAIRAVSAAILAIATNIACSSEDWDEADSGLRQAMINANSCITEDGRSKVRCRVFCCGGRTTVTLLDPDKGLLLSRSRRGSMVYSDPACSIWLVDDLQP